jgi:hypothetical protein
MLVQKVQTKQRLQAVIFSSKVFLYLLTACVWVLGFSLLHHVAE